MQKKKKRLCWTGWQEVTVAGGSSRLTVRSLLLGKPLVPLDRSGIRKETAACLVIVALSESEGRPLVLG